MSHTNKLDEPSRDARTMRRMLFICSILLSLSLLAAAYIARPARFVFLWPPNSDRPLRFDIYTGKAQVFFPEAIAPRQQQMPPATKGAK
jgi:hypothetical protein